MLKTAVFCVALATALGAAATVSQARQVLIWGQYYTVDDDPVVVRLQPKFNALAAHPERYERGGRRQIELDQQK